MLKYSSAVILVLILVIGVTTISLPNYPEREALDQLVEAERAFARFAVENGVRESFIAFFADDGINFQPHPTKTKQAMMSRPPSPRPLAITLNWEPVYADVSRAGDLGYTTGPYTLRDNSPQPKPTSYGYYFSIWKRQADGNWKVEVDCGISAPDPGRAEPLAFHPATPGLFNAKKPIDLETEREKLLDVERKFATSASLQKSPKAYANVLAGDARLHRNGLAPFTGLKAIVAQLDKNSTALSWSPLQCDVAASADLGYTYGSYESRNPSTQTLVETGYYVHVWKRTLNGEWKLVLDTMSPLPEQK